MFAHARRNRRDRRDSRASGTARLAWSNGTRRSSRRRAWKGVLPAFKSTRVRCSHTACRYRATRAPASPRNASPRLCAVQRLTRTVSVTVASIRVHSESLRPVGARPSAQPTQHAADAEGEPPSPSCSSAQQLAVVAGAGERGREWHSDRVQAESSWRGFGKSVLGALSGVKVGRSQRTHAALGSSVGGAPLRRVLRALIAGHV